jgi:tetratricopeptide (TPR) repeat protein
MKSRQVDERRRCRLNLALALLYETRALSRSSESLSKSDNLAAAANFETYVEIKDRNGLPVEDKTLNLDKDWHVPSVLYQMSELYLRLERYEDAVKTAERALASSDTKDSVRPFLYYVEVRAYEKLDDKAKMITTLERLRDLYKQELENGKHLYIFHFQQRKFYFDKEKLQFYRLKTKLEGNEIKNIIN